MEVKDYLERPTKLYRNIKRNEECVAYWHRKASTVSATPFDKEKVSSSRSTSAPFVSAIEKAVDLERMIQRQYGELAELKAEVSATIGLLEDPMMQLILLCRYIQMMPWDDVMAELSLPSNTMFRFHRLALEKLQEEMVQ